MARHFSAPGGYSVWGGDSLPIYGLPAIRVTARQAQEGKDPMSGDTVAGIKVYFTFPLLGDMMAWLPVASWPEGEAAAILAVYRAQMEAARTRMQQPWSRAEQIPSNQPVGP